MLWRIRLGWWLFGIFHSVKLPTTCAKYDNDTINQCHRCTSVRNYCVSGLDWTATGLVRTGWSFVLNRWFMCWMNVESRRRLGKAVTSLTLRVVISTVPSHCCRTESVCDFSCTDRTVQRQSVSSLLETHGMVAGDGRGRRKHRHRPTSTVPGWDLLFRRTPSIKMLYMDWYERTSVNE